VGAVYTHCWLKRRK